MTIEIKNLSKSFGSLDVLSDISILFKESAITAVLGPNAAGKSTLIKCILGITKPDNGIITIDNDIINGKTDYLNKIGYIPQKVQFPFHLRVKDLFEVVTEIHSKHTIADLDLDLYSNFKIKEIENKLLVNLSGGTLQKVNSTIGFLFSPNILILDEPTVGLDPIAIRHLKQKIISEKEKGKTIILTSHIPDIVERFADNIIFLHEGNILFNNSIDALYQEFNSNILEDCLFQLMKKEES